MKIMRLSLFLLTIWRQVQLNLIFTTEFTSTASSSDDCFEYCESCCLFICWIISISAYSLSYTGNRSIVYGTLRCQSINETYLVARESRLLFDQKRWFTANPFNYFPLSIDFLSRTLLLRRTIWISSPYASSCTLLQKILFSSAELIIMLSSNRLKNSHDEESSWHICLLSYCLVPKFFLWPGAWWMLNIWFIRWAQSV